MSLSSLFGGSPASNGGNALNLATSQTSVVFTTFSLSASLPASSTVSGVMYPFGLSQPSQVSIVVPSTEKWYLADFYVDSALAVDLQIQFVINGIVQPLVVNLNSTIVSNSARFHLPTPILVMPNQTFSVNAITYTVNGTAASTENVYLAFVRMPV